MGPLKGRGPRWRTPDLHVFLGAHTSKSNAQKKVLVIAGLSCFDGSALTISVCTKTTSCSVKSISTKN